MSLYQLKVQFQDQLRPISDTLVHYGITANQITISSMVLSAGTAYLITHIHDNHHNEQPDNHPIKQPNDQINQHLIPNLEINLSRKASPNATNQIRQVVGSVSLTDHEKDSLHYRKGNTEYFDNQYSLSRKAWFVLPIALFVRMALNAIDGMMAREHGQASLLGAILNEVGDILSDSLLISSLHPHLPANLHYSGTNASRLDHPTSLNAPLSETSSKNIKQRYFVILDAMTHHANHPLNLINVLSLTTELIAILSSILIKERTNQGPLGKSDRALELGVIGLLAGFNAPLAKFIKPLLVVNEILLLKTSYNRLSFLAQRCFDLAHPAPQSRDVNEAVQKAYLSEKSQSPQNTLLPKRKNISDSTLLKDTTMSDTPYKDVASSSPQTVTDIIALQDCYNAYDGTALFYRYWLTKPLADIKAQTAQPKAALNDKTSIQASENGALKQVILLHRGHEHSGRLSELGEQYAKAGYQVFAWDARGNGRSGGIKDHADSVTQLERDLDDFVNLIVSKTGIAIENTLIVACSIGAVLAAAWVHDYAPNIRGMILGTPAISIRLYIPFAIPALKSARKFGLMSRVSSYVKARVLTHDKEAQLAYNEDPLISSSISSDLLIDTHATGQRLLDDAGAITAPTFVLCAGKDYVVDKQAERDFYDHLASPIKKWQLYPDSFHAIFHENNRSDVITDCIHFADSLFNTPIQQVDLTDAHINSDSKDRVDRLAIKPFNPSFAVTRFAMQKFGHISEAIATGLEHGFDSGSSLDKVYNNQPAGKNTIGKMIDKFYLSNIGWQGIRIRREHLLELASIAIANRQHAKQNSTSNTQSIPINLLDIASGNAFYAFDLLSSFDCLTAELRDYEAHNISVIQEKAETLGLSSRVTAIQKDAFDANSYKDLTATYDVAITSGVFELFSDNSLVQTAISGIYDSLDSGGYFIYTNQPWHPEQEFISKTLNNHRGTSWVMRCRSQAEMDQLVTQAGFEKVDMRIDRFGIFTVSLAIKPATDSHTV